MTQNEKFGGHVNTTKQGKRQEPNNVEKRCEVNFDELEKRLQISAYEFKPKMVEKFDKTKGQKFEKNTETELKNGNKNNNPSPNEATMSPKAATLSQNEANLSQNKANPSQIEATINNRNEKTMAITIDDAKHAIGKKGRNVKKLESNHRVKITSKKCGNRCIMKITGNSEAVQRTYSETMKTINSAKNKPTAVCRYFLDGKCWYGNKCKFRHHTSTTPRRDHGENNRDAPEMRTNQTPNTWRGIRHTAKEGNIFSCLA